MCYFLLSGILNMEMSLSWLLALTGRISGSILMAEWTAKEDGGIWVSCSIMLTAWLNLIERDWSLLYSFCVVAKFIIETRGNGVIAIRSWKSPQFYLNITPDNLAAGVSIKPSVSWNAEHVFVGSLFSKFDDMIFWLAFQVLGRIYMGLCPFA